MARSEQLTGKGRNRVDKALKRQARTLEHLAELKQHDWLIFKRCEFCGRKICVNNYPDRKSRTPKLKGKVICSWCDPRSSISGKVPLRNLEGYRTVMCRIAIEKLIPEHYRDKDHDQRIGDCLLCKMERIMDEDGSAR